MSNTKMKNKNLDDKDSSNNDATQIKGNKKNEGSKNDKPINTYDKSDLNVEKITNKLFDDLISKRDLLKKEIYSLEKKKDELNKDMQQSFSEQSDRHPVTSRSCHELTQSAGLVQDQSSSS